MDELQLFSGTRISRSYYNGVDRLLLRSRRYFSSVEYVQLRQGQLLQRQREFLIQVDLHGMLLDTLHTRARDTIVGTPLLGAFTLRS